MFYPIPVLSDVSTLFTRKSAAMKACLPRCFPVNRISWLVLGLVLANCIAGPASAQRQPDPPDYTAGDKPPAKGPHDWNMGPTGARGYFYAFRDQTTHARQWYISKVAQGSPADGQLEPGDVILGIGNNRFSHDARVELAQAIQQAQANRGGRLVLQRWRDGQTRMVSIRLQVMPDFSPTAPYDCEKSAMLLEAGAAALAAKGLARQNLPNHINALALLATGEEAYRPMVRDYARKLAERDLSQYQGLHSWEYAFNTLLLAEYYLATQDDRVLPAIRKQALEIARGQSRLGNWGHRFVRPELGRLGGYGSINSVSVTLATAMALARECGVDEPELDAAIQRSADFYRRYVNLGSIPYGDHPPNLQYGHDDNGKNSNAAIFFDLIGDKQATEYYRRTALAAINADREQGHTGNFFNILWALPGVQRCGPLATGGFLEEFGWYYDLARDHEHGYPYQGLPGTRRDSYQNWDCPGVFLLHLALPHQQLRILGKGEQTLPPMTAEEVEITLDAGRHNYPTMTPEQLTQALSSWSPIVRYEAAEELKRRKVAPTTDAARLVSAPEADQQLAGLNAAVIDKPQGQAIDPVFNAAAMMLSNGSMPVKVQAVRTLIAIDRERATPLLLSILAAYEPADNPVLTLTIVNELFPRNGKGDFQPLNLVEDRGLALAAARKVLDHEDARVIGHFVPSLKTLSDRELAQLMPDIVQRGATDTRGNFMFMMGARNGCLRIASEYRIEEAIEPLVELALYEGWGRSGALQQALPLLGSYGSAAAEYLPRLRETMQKEKDDRLKGLFDRTIQQISGDNNPPRSVTIAEFQRQAGLNTN